MKITADRKHFLDQLGIVSRALPSGRSSKPILANVKLSATGDSVRLLGTDLEVGISLLVTAGISGPGDLLLPAMKVSQFLSASSAEEITIESTSSGAVVVSGRSRFTFGTDKPEEYPTVSEIETPLFAVALDSNAVALAVSRVAFAIGDSNRFAIGGCYFDFSDEPFHVVATDGRRMAISDFGGRVVSGQATSPIIPERCVMALRAFLASSSGECAMKIDRNAASFSVLEGFIYCRQLEGRYPAWHTEIPPKDNSVAVLPTAPLTEAVCQACVAGMEDSHGVRFTFDSGSLRLKSDKTEAGESAAELACDDSDLACREITLDGLLVRDFLRAVSDCDAVSVYLRSAVQPAIFYAGDSFRYSLASMAKE